MADFTIGEPTEMPSDIGRYHSKWSDLLARVLALTNGKAIPLEFSDLHTANTFANGKASTFRRRGVRVQRRGNVVYLSKVQP